MNPSYAQIRARVDAAAQAAGHAVRLLAVSKTKPAAAIRELAAQGQRAFGENYVQEAIAKQGELSDLNLEWHLIGPLQSNKCREVALHFDWLQSLDREKLVEPLNRFRPADAAPLNVLIQVNIDGEASKSGCAPEAIPALAAKFRQAPRLRLRGLMAIPAPADVDARIRAFTRMRGLFESLRTSQSGIDTLSMGMSDDFESAIAHGATLVRIGTALFGARAPVS
ncbi:MAG TPA: YggS family pyridoxal phosphate-dependent enzyme [Rudaea sp.]|nr:YggS family pyridoxal phosphate-dependent enzyme [Rudaea sp.]